MKTKTGMSIGLALTLMVGVFATMLALGLFTNFADVRAQVRIGRHYGCNSVVHRDGNIKGRGRQRQSTVTLRHG